MRSFDALDRGEGGIGGAGNPLVSDVAQRCADEDPTDAAARRASASPSSSKRRRASSVAGGTSRAVTGVLFPDVVSRVKGTVHT